MGFLISDTGGAHRSAAQAIAAALEHRYPGRFAPIYIDVFRSYAPVPWKFAPNIYPHWIAHSSFTYGLFFAASDLLLRVRAAKDGFAQGTGKRMLAKLMAEHRPDILVVIHAILTRPISAGRRALGVTTPLVSVVTDFARPHVAWYHPDVDRCLVTSSYAEELGYALGLGPEQLRMVGFLVHPKFALYSASKAEAREELGWGLEQPAVLILGGGEGMGKLSAIAKAIDDRLTGVQLAIVCGRNHKLRQGLKHIRWRSPVHLYGFVERVEVLMRAADVLVSKAGPLTIGEAAVSGLPMILHGAIPFQESQNATYVVWAGAGVYETRPRKIADLLADWLRPGSTALRRHAAAARKLAHPGSAFVVADEIASLCGLPPNSTTGAYRAPSSEG